MHYQEFSPHPLLAPYVKLLWILEGRPLSPAAERILPDSLVELVLHYGDPFLTRFQDGRREQQERAFAVSQTTRSIEISPSGRAGFIAVRFFPWGAYHFFDTPVCEFSDRFIPADQLWGAGAGFLLEQVSEAGDALARVRIVEHFLLRQLARCRKDEVGAHVRFIWEQGGPVAVSRLTDRFGITERTLQRRFRAALGASPRQVGRIARFLGACRFLRQGDYRTLADAAQSCGYYDQPHLAREFRELADLTPVEFCSDGAISFFTLD